LQGVAKVICHLVLKDGDSSNLKILARNSTNQVLTTNKQKCHKWFQCTHIVLPFFFQVSKIAAEKTVIFGKYFEFSVPDIPGKSFSIEVFNQVDLLHSVRIGQVSQYICQYLQHMHFIWFFEFIKEELFFARVFQYSILYFIYLFVFSVL
jgi:hypothetical protein